MKQMDADSKQQAQITDLLKEVSRSFYLTLPVLPASVRPQIGLAYLLARSTDTIADTQLISIAQRLYALQSMRLHISGAGQKPLDFGPLAAEQSSVAERALLDKCNASLDLM